MQTRTSLMTDHFKTNEDIRVATQKLLVYCRANERAGYDPYDALSSRLFAAVPMLDRRIPRLVLTQALKRLPVNVRPLLAIPKTQISKGLALILSAFINLPRMGEKDEKELEEQIAFMIDSIVGQRAA